MNFTAKNIVIWFFAGLIYGVISVGLFISALGSIPAGEIEAQQKASLLQKANCESENTKPVEGFVDSVSNVTRKEFLCK